MPNGMTQDLHDGPQTFQEFVWGAARSFGALMHLRDEPMSAAIDIEPEPIEKNHHYEHLCTAIDELKGLKDDPDAAIDRHLAKLSEDGVRQAQERGKRVRRAMRYREMLQHVLEWEPPSPEHEELKARMVNSLENSLHWDTQAHASASPEVQASASREQLWLGQVAFWANEVAYHYEQLQKDMERMRVRTAWLQALNESVPLPEQLKP